MQNKIVFREMLSELKKIADEQGNQITKEEVSNFFSKGTLTEEQIELVCEYLTSQKIKVLGYSAKEVAKEEEKTEILTEESMEERPDFLEMYLEELADIEKISQQEEEKLFLEAVNGDSLAKSKLASQYLETVYELARTYIASELPMEDLIQEGNIGLLLALENLESKADLEEYRQTLFSGIQKAMEEAAECSRDEKDLDEEIVGRVNHLNEAILNLEEDLGHKVSMSELSAYLEMPMEEIQDLLRMAGDEMKEKEA